MIQIDRADPELGTVRRCVVCGEDWPLDDEFFGRSGGYLRRACRACHSDQCYRLWLARTMRRYATDEERRAARRDSWRTAQRRRRKSRMHLGDKSLPGHARASENQDADQPIHGGASMSVTQS